MKYSLSLREFSSARPTHVMLIPFRRVCVITLITLELFQISIDHGSFDNLLASSASSAKVESADPGSERMLVP